MSNKKADAGLGMFLIVALIALVFVWYVNISQRECSSNKDCNFESYCGSDFSCHPYPVIQKTEVHYSLWLPSLIIAIAIVIAAALFNWDKVERIMKKDAKNNISHQEIHKDNETVEAEEHEDGHTQVQKGQKEPEQEYYKPNSNP